ncbi:MAG: hypothetical protein QMD09_06000 [Desulfatibacillaceae bacterium]|nr:hypothetical protein [Desulfatibacillaceae bacterium]
MRVEALFAGLARLFVCFLIQVFAFCSRSARDCSTPREIADDFELGVAWGGPGKAQNVKEGPVKACENFENPAFDAFFQIV